MNWRETPSELERTLTEQPVVVPGPMGDLIGIFTPPASDAPPAGMCVIFLARPRFGHRRIQVEGARRLATDGFGCFRFDFHGWGDSEGECSSTDIDKPERGDIVAVIRYLREAFGQRRFVLSGTCFGARTALSAFLDEADAIEGLAFVSAPVGSLAASDVYSWRNVARWSLDRELWRELIFSTSSRRRAANALRLVARRLFGGTLDGQLSSLSPVFEEHFRALVRSQAQALFLYGSDDDEYRSFQAAERDLFSKLPPETRRRFEIAVWPGRVHSVLDVKRQREVVDKWVSWIGGLHPNVTGAAKALKQA